MDHHPPSLSHPTLHFTSSELPALPEGGWIYHLIPVYKEGLHQSFSLFWDWDKLSFDVRTARQTIVGTNAPTDQWHIRQDCGCGCGYSTEESPASFLTDMQKQIYKQKVSISGLYLSPGEAPHDNISLLFKQQKKRAVERSLRTPGLFQEVKGVSGHKA